MSTVLIANSTELSGDSTAMNGIFALRHKIFEQRLGWDVTSKNGLERDLFDDLNPTYMLVKGDDAQAVSGCWRVLPTTGPYMLKDVFPMLLRGESAPSDPSIWEISRFAVMPESEAENVQGIIHPATLEILRQGYNFAVDNRIKHYVAVTSVAMERFLIRIVGVPMRRFGDGKSQIVGGTLSVACWIDVDEHLYHALFVRNAGINFSRPL